MLRLSDLMYGEEFFEPRLEKYDLLKSAAFKTGLAVCVLELHVEKCWEDSEQRRFVIAAHLENADEERNAAQSSMLVIHDAKSAEIEYEKLFRCFADRWLMLPFDGYVDAAIGSLSFQKRQQDWHLTEPALQPQVVELLEYVWQEAHGELESRLTCSVRDITINKVNEAESILLQIRKAQTDDEPEYKLVELTGVYYDTISRKHGQTIKTLRQVVTEQELLQLIRDVITVTEITGSDGKNQTHAAIYRALGCCIRALDEDDRDYADVADLVMYSQHLDSNIEIDNIYSVSRNVEQKQYRERPGISNLLFHASSVPNIMGIMSRGLLMPRVVVDELGGQRTDVGMLGSGLYFSDSASTSLKYAKPGASKGTRMLFVNQVSLGAVMQTTEFDTKLTCAPPGYDAMHGIRGTPCVSSDFQDDEFVVYDTNQQKIVYLVEFHVPGDRVRTRMPVPSIHSAGESRTCSKLFTGPQNVAAERQEQSQVRWQTLLHVCDFLKPGRVSLWLAGSRFTLRTMTERVEKLADTQAEAIRKI